MPSTNFDEFKNNFELTKGIKSLLLYTNVPKRFKPFFTVAVPTYKRTHLLKESLQSICRQKNARCKYEVLVLDNESYTGEKNANYHLIRRLKIPNISYYQNEKTLRVGDNFNRAILLAKAPWVVFLHDDDILLSQTLNKLYRAVQFLNTFNKKPLGAIGGNYVTFSDDLLPSKLKKQMTNLEIKHSQMSLAFYPVMRFQCLFNSHPGGVLPSNGTLFNKSAMLSVGGFNDDLGISADCFLFYQLNRKYCTYISTEPYGFYRLGNNSMNQLPNKLKTIANCQEFREYIFHKNIFLKLYGFLFRNRLNAIFIQRFFPELEKTLITQYPPKIINSLGKRLETIFNKYVEYCMHRQSRAFYKYEQSHKSNR